MGLNSLCIIIHITMTMPTVNTMRLYFSDLSIAEKIDMDRLTLLHKSEITRIYSSEGIFLVNANKLTRAQIQDQSIENITIKNIELIVDKSSIKYDVDWYQINPYHIMETIDVYTYTLPTHTLPTHTVSNTQLILEKQDKHVNALYFLIYDNDFNNDSISTFLSDLNLC